MTYKGHVFDLQHLPVSGIAVSDGRNVSYTNADGYFELTGYERSRLIYVCVLTRKHDDWYIHTVGHMGDYDFYIDSVETTSDFCFLHTSDTELLGRGCEDWIEFMREQVKLHQPAFLVHTGDICYEEGLKKHYQEMNMATTGCPVRYVIGNHDYVEGNYGEELYEKLYGPAWYSFNCGEIHFVALAIGEGDKPSGYEPEDQWKWLLNDLKHVGQDKKLIVLNHTHCKDVTGFKQTAGNIVIDFKEYGLLAWVFGHYHANVLETYDGIFNIGTSRPNSGGIDSSVGGLRKISLKEHVLTSEMLYFTLPVNASDKYVWRTGLPGRVFFSTPIIMEEDVIVCTADDDYLCKCGVYRISGESGRIKWSYLTESSVKNDAAYDNGNIYVQDTKGWLYCIHGEDGSLIWKALTVIPGAGYTLTGVLVVGDTVFAGTMQLVQAFCKKDGSLRWMAQESIQYDCSPTRFVYDETRRQLIVGDQWVKLYAVDLESGAILWKNESDVRFRTSTPLLQGDKIYTATYNSAVIISAETGETLLQRKTGCGMEVSGAPAYENGVLYYPTADNGVLAVDADNLEVIRQFPTDYAAVLMPPYAHGKIKTVESTPQIIGDWLIFSACDGSVRFYDKRDGFLVNCIWIGAPCIATPIVGKDFVVTADFAGNVTKFRI